MRKYPEWRISDLAHICRERQKNKLDTFICVVGSPGSGKSSLGWKTCFKVGKNQMEDMGINYNAGYFRPKTDMVYERSELNSLLKNRKFRVVLSDEMIRSSYNREFQNKEQHELIKIINMYRCNFNILVGLIPFFYDCDPDLRSLVDIRIDIIRRGVGLVHQANVGLYSNDPWDTKYNSKIEEEWKKKRLKHPNYWKLTTFKGIVYWNPLSSKSELKYQRIRDYKKGLIEDSVTTKDKRSLFYENLIKMANEGNITKEELRKICLTNGVKYTSVLSQLNEILKNDGKDKTFLKILVANSKNDNKSSNNSINDVNQRSYYIPKNI